ncbi:MAG: hypothetical protein C6Y22_08265 [Hapalosiphonaceae cyanobacterium JJU2]|nr:MAG: hypothetical protein C6Y22_08265 [Hapalosiphonaceae cyanobacterium JJU2]
MRKPQVRAVIASDLVSVAEDIMAETGISTHSQLVCLLIKNFGNELQERLKGEKSQLSQPNSVGGEDA